jgi:DNA-binding response OmpR family regulator
MRLLLISTTDPHPLSQRLLDHGYQVETAHGGEVGLVAFCRAAIDGAPFDAVVADLPIPNVDGAQVIDRIRAIAPHTLTLWLTRL